MEAFEHIVKVFLESRGYVVTTNVKFPVKRKTKKADRIEEQTHGYEVDIVGAKSSSLLLGSVKSFFGSGGVNRQGFKGISDSNKETHYDSYKIFNEPEVRKGILEEATKIYGYSIREIELSLFVGRFKRNKGEHKAIEEERIITEHLQKIKEAGSVKVYNLWTIMDGVVKAAKPKTYLNDPVVVTIKALQMAGLLQG